MERAVLAVGLDPRAVAAQGSAVSGLPPVDPSSVRAGAAASQARLTDLGFDVDVCFLEPAQPDAADTFRAKVAGRRYDAVMIGAGLRFDPTLTFLFETLVNTTRQEAPDAVLVFNVDPASSAAAVERWFPSKPSA